jgi:hypothetical protein
MGVFPQIVIRSDDDASGTCQRKQRNLLGVTKKGQGPNDTSACERFDLTEKQAWGQ